MVAVWVALAVGLLAGVAEAVHARRTRRLARLAFGPTGRPRAWVRGTPAARVLALAVISWGLVTLLLVPPRAYRAKAMAEGQEEHILILLDVSPSMRLADAGPQKDQPRRLRMRDVMRSFFRRVPTERYRVSVLAVYTDAKPVVIDTRDIDVVMAIMGELPLYQAFQPGKTHLFRGLEVAAKTAHGWRPGSTILVVLTDGDTVPARGMPQMPPSVRQVLVVGVGDPSQGTFIDGRQSRQDVATLRQLAARLRGTYHDGNEQHLDSSTLAAILATGKAHPADSWTRREYALLAVALGSLLVSLLPLALHYAGTNWRPGRDGRFVDSSLALPVESVTMR